MITNAVCRIHLRALAYLLLTFFSLAVLLAIPSQPVALAAPLTPAQAALHTIHLTSASSADDAGHVTIIVLDMSGSMGTNDPRGIRCSAANAYIDLSRANDYIGVIGLDNNNGQRSGNHDFQTAINWTTPLSAATVADRERLRTLIKEKSNSCHPDSTTPTYNALDQALTMLNDFTSGKHISGSVILLTDGTPSPDTNAQIQDIQSDLLPQFKQNHWPIDTVALGKDGPVSGMNITFHDFLSNIASSTSGKFYDDTHGPVQGDVNGSPLNIAPFFIDIFQRRVGRTPGQDIPPTQLDGGVVQQNFTVTDYTNNLDVVVVKDQAGTTASLITPSGQTITPTSGDVLVSQDNYYIIFSIDQPLPGTWELDVSGSGQFLMDSLKKSSIGISTPALALKNSNIPATDTMPLGQPLVVTASLTSNGQSITDNSFTVSGTIAYSGGAGEYSQAFSLSDSSVPGTYVGYVTVPQSAPAGSYDIQLAASTVSLTNLVSSSTRSIRLELFPIPELLSPQTQLPTDQLVQTSVLQWPGLLRGIYSLPVFSALSGWPLQGKSAQPITAIPGVVQWQGKAYNDPATRIQAQAYQQGSKQAIPVTIVQNSPGQFHVQFIPPASGTYSLVFDTTGNYKDSHGDFGPTERQILITVAQPSDSMVLRAYLITLFYLLVIVFLIFLVKFELTPRPFGEWTRSVGGEGGGGLRFSRAHRNPIQWFFRRNQLKSRQAGMPKGLLLKFGYGGSIQVRPDGRASADWQLLNGSPLRNQYQRVSELIFRPGGSGEPGLGSDEPTHYVIKAQSGQASSYQPDNDFGSYAVASSSRSKKGKRPRSQSSFDVDYDAAPSRQSGRGSSRKNKNRKRNGPDDYYW